MITTGTLYSLSDRDAALTWPWTGACSISAPMENLTTWTWTMRYIFRIVMEDGIHTLPLLYCWLHNCSRPFSFLLYRKELSLNLIHLTNFICNYSRYYMYIFNCYSFPFIENDFFSHTTYLDYGFIIFSSFQFLSKSFPTFSFSLENSLLRSNNQIKQSKD